MKDWICLYWKMIDVMLADQKKEIIPIDRPSRLCLSFRNKRAVNESCDPVE